MWHQLANQDIYIMKVPDSEEREKERGAGRERKEDREIIWRNNGQKFPKFDERFESTNIRSTMKSKYDKLKEIHTEFSEKIKDGHGSRGPWVGKAELERDA